MLHVNRLLRQKIAHRKDNDIELYDLTKICYKYISINSSSDKLNFDTFTSILFIQQFKSNAQTYMN
ncbi:hypothetical protein NIES267_17550 [Calothrix parasitica NIES-267]|uniref:Uncharacterized protein n=1 Tax=Calothrix parasitica NIES-267 TaxID=1973488 RepID=A0A1Z4LM23_9CYAN|nr:hypothetical protein NIES267_17550 [Calothrix parasitica NIES-267]